MLLRLLVLAILFVSVVSAQPPVADDRFYHAIRRDDLTALAALVDESGVDARDAQGQTPLMLAAAFGSPDALRLLLSRKADARAASTGGVTALHLAAPDADKVRMLLDAGADVNAVSQLGRTPLIVAAAATGSLEAVRLLLAKGATLDAADGIGITPLIGAAVVNDGRVVKHLLERGAAVNATAKTGQAATALMGAATNGNLEIVSTLLDRSANVNAVTADDSATVKNGRVQFGRVTALHFAALSGNPDVVRRLLAAGASVDALDIRGMTPLMLAVSTDRPDARIVRLLLDAGANPVVSSKAGETVVDWARKFQNPDILRELKLSAPTGRAPAPASIPVLPLPAHATARAAVERSLPLLRGASERMLTHGGCVACHAQPLTGIAVTLAHDRGWTSQTAEAETRQVLTTLTALSPPLIQLRESGGLPDGAVYITWWLATQGQAPTRATDVIVRYLAAKQRGDGSWEGVGGSRAPMQDGNLSRTALSIRALTAFATPARAAEYRGRVRQAAAWLERQTPKSTEDRIMQLLGLHWAGSASDLRRRRISELVAIQRADGGWAQTPYLESDAYATGQVLYALRQLGLSGTDSAVRRGSVYLRRTQAADGTWHVRNRAMKVQPYFEGGFPYEHDQWISQAGTAWAVMGLTTTEAEPATVTATNR
jgi:ankyrin repeat protein